MSKTSIPIYQVDAFTATLFSGNPAAVCPLEKWLPDDMMQSIAAENNLAETAFFVPWEDGYHLRWFTPAIEVDLCGHATLATAHVLYEHLDYQGEQIKFYSRSGILTVVRSEGKYILNFPADKALVVEEHPDWLACFNTEVEELYRGKDDFLLVVKDQQAVELLKPDYLPLREVEEARGFIVTAPGNEKYDFVSRCFYGPAGIDEDPVTGSAHTLLTTYWADRLGKDHLFAKQISLRGGELECLLQNDRVLLKGNAITFFTGEIVNLNS